MPGLIREARISLDRLRTAPRKRLGQHFMVDETALSAIAEALSLTSGDTVVEIGPGLGFLTRLLLKSGAEVVAIEKDRAFVNHLRNSLGAVSARWVESDVLKVDLEKDLGIRGRVKVAGNIPYNITTPILEWLVSQRGRLKYAVLTLQEEVAERLSATPGGKAWGSLSVFIQVYARSSVLRKIGRSCFWPPPKVDSAVVRLDFTSAKRPAITDEAWFFEVVRRAFRKRRKTILNSLSDKAGGVFEKKAVSSALSGAGVETTRRPETLGLDEWADLADRLRPSGA